jgi:DNA-binding transcriptional regulator YiaG
VSELITEIEATLGSPQLLADPKRFADLLVRAMDELGLDDGDVAGRLPVSRSVVTRWRHGTSVPLPMARKPVYHLLLRRLKAR